MQRQFDTSSLGIEGLGWCAVSTGHIQPSSTGRKGQLHFTISIQYLLAIIHSEGFITQSCEFRLRISFANESGHWRSHSLLRQHKPTRQSWQPASMPRSLEPTHNPEGPSPPQVTWGQVVTLQLSQFFPLRFYVSVCLQESQSRKLCPHSFLIYCN